MRPGRARAPRPSSEAVEWLKQQKGGGWPRESREAKRQRLRAEQKRIAELNERVRKRHGLRRGEIG